MSKPNILVILTDQLTFSALPAYGNTYVKTPNIDRIAKESAVFEKCYTSCPLCQPARASLWSSKYPHEIDVLSNGRNWPVGTVPQSMPTLGETFKNAGYNTYHFGKCHDAGALRGFVCEPEQEIKVDDEHKAFPLNFDTYQDRYTTVKSVEFLKNYAFEKPLLMVADLVNPHNICGWIGAYKGVHENIDTGLELPPLPENFDFDDIENRPKAVQYICCSHNRQAETSGWTRENYQQYLQAYYYYLQLVDKEIGLILDALESTGKKDDTLIVFTADHGDSMAARGRVTKQVDFYDEVVRVPLIFSGKGVVSHKKHQGLTSLLDLFPTLCGYAGIEIPTGLRGMDISQALLGKSLPKREYTASQWHTEWGFTVSPGRMICTEDFKYTYYIEDKGEELYDLKKDAYEKTNLAKNPHYSEALKQMRRLMNNYLEDTADDFMNLQWYADKKWRSHKPGYQNHTGIAAPQESK